MKAKLELVLSATFALSACGAPQAGMSSAPTWANLGHRCSPDAPAVSLPDSARASLAAPPGVAGEHNASLAQFARQIPGGWGGFSLDHGAPTILLVDTTRRAEAIAAINQHGVVGQMLGSNVRVRKARWDF